MSRLCGMTYRLGKFVDKSAAIKIYYSSVYSVLSYCIATWGGTMLCTRRADNLLRLQKRIVTNLFSKFYPRSDNIFRDASIIKIPDVYKLRVAIYMYSIIVDKSIPSLKRQLFLEDPGHNYDTRTANTLRLPFPRVEVIRMNFRYQFVNIWNGIPEDIKSKPSKKSFKRAYIQYIINNYD